MLLSFNEGQVQYSMLIESLRYLIYELRLRQFNKCDKAILARGKNRNQCLYLVILFDSSLRRHTQIICTYMVGICVGTLQVFCCFGLLLAKIEKNLLSGCLSSTLIVLKLRHPDNVIQVPREPCRTCTYLYTLSV